MEKVALVTAAGSGLGAACARKLAERGFRLAVSSSSERGRQLGEELGGIGFTASNTSAEDLAHVVERTFEHFGRIDVVVNSCGHIPSGDLLEIEDEVWHEALDMILLAVVRIARAVTPIFLRQGSGAIVNISSFAAVEPDLAYPVSSSLRAGLASFCKLYSNRYASDGIRMNNVLPGFVSTRWPETDINRARIPAGRYGTDEEVAETVWFLASDGSRYVTGQNIGVDGGLIRSI